MLSPSGFQRIPALQTKKRFLLTRPSLSLPSYHPRAMQGHPPPHVLVAAQLGLSPHRLTNPTDGINLSTKLSTVTEHAQLGDTGTRGVQERCCWDSQATMLGRKEPLSAQPSASPLRPNWAPSADLGPFWRVTLTKGSEPQGGDTYLGRSCHRCGA